MRITENLRAVLFFVDANPPLVSSTLIYAWEWDVGDVPPKSGRFTIVFTTTMAPIVTAFSMLTTTVSIGAVSRELETSNNAGQAAVFVSAESTYPLLKGNFMVPYSSPETVAGVSTIAAWSFRGTALNCPIGASVIRTTCPSERFGIGLVRSIAARVLRNATRQLCNPESLPRAETVSPEQFVSITFQAVEAKEEEI